MVVVVVVMVVVLVVRRRGYHWGVLNAQHTTVYRDDIVASATGAVYPQGLPEMLTGVHMSVGLQAAIQSNRLWHRPRGLAEAAWTPISKHSHRVVGEASVHMQVYMHVYIFLAYQQYAYTYMCVYIYIYVYMY